MIMRKKVVCPEGTCEVLKSFKKLHKGAAAYDGCCHKCKNRRTCENECEKSIETCEAMGNGR